MVDDELIERSAAEINQPYIVTAGVGDGGIQYQVRGFLRSKSSRYAGDRCWVIEAYVMYHLIPVANIVEVRRESRRYVW